VQQKSRRSGLRVRGSGVGIGSYLCVREWRWRSGVERSLWGVLAECLHVETRKGIGNRIVQARDVLCRDGEIVLCGNEEEIT
jgi:hypothetical protein